jgi:hypothetical protein
MTRQPFQTGAKNLVGHAITITKNVCVCVCEIHSLLALLPPISLVGPRVWIMFQFLLTHCLSTK